MCLPWSLMARVRTLRVAQHSGGQPQRGRAHRDSKHRYFSPPRHMGKLEQCLRLSARNGSEAGGQARGPHGGMRVEANLQGNTRPTLSEKCHLHPPPTRFLPTTSGDPHILDSVERRAGRPWKHSQGLAGITVTSREPSTLPWSPVTALLPSDLLGDRSVPFPWLETGISLWVVLWFIAGWIMGVRGEPRAPLPIHHSSLRAAA